MDQQVNVSFKLIYYLGKNNMLVLITYIRPETGRSNLKQVEKYLMNILRTELVNVAKFWDDFELGVKCQSSSVIAGSLRKLF